MSKQFTGVFIPAEIIGDPRLKPIEKILLGYMGSFNGRFFAGNAHVAKMLAISETSVANLMSGLRKRGYIQGRTATYLGRKPTCLGNEPTYSGNIDQSIDQSSEKKRKAASPDLSVYEKGEQRETLIGLVADRGIGKEYIAPTIDITIKEVRAGLSPEPINWPAYLAGRIRKENRKAKAFEPRKPPAPVSQFSKVYG